SRLACLCGADAAYEAHAESFAQALKRAGAEQVWLAGKPGDREAAWRAAGIDGFIFAGCDAIEANSALLRVLGGAV
ncbi:MAG: methylmalonyl-CoA mutase, partial [Roseiarcus sp.]